MTDTTAQSCPRYIVIDLFRGGGGFSTGFIQAVVSKHRDEIARETDIPPESVSRDHELVLYRSCSGGGTA